MALGTNPELNWTVALVIVPVSKSEMVSADVIGGIGWYGSPSRMLSVDVSSPDRTGVRLIVVMLIA